MEEGKRMFSIFAARMFEQRVLQAYRCVPRFSRLLALISHDVHSEKVAQERQMQLLRELEDEDKMKEERELKKQREKEKKKDKKRCEILSCT